VSLNWKRGTYKRPTPAFTFAPDQSKVMIKEIFDCASYFKPGDTAGNWKRRLCSFELIDKTSKKVLIEVKVDLAPYVKKIL